MYPMATLQNKGLVWLRRDLRVHDHHALRMAIKHCKAVFVCFVFDTDILSALLERGLSHDRRIDFIWQSLVEIDTELRSHGGGLIVRHGRAIDLIPKLAQELGVDHVYCNKDYEPSAIERDLSVKKQLASQKIEFSSLKDQVIFEEREVLTQTVLCVYAL